MSAARASKARSSIPEKTASPLSQPHPGYGEQRGDPLSLPHGTPTGLHKVGLVGPDILPPSPLPQGQETTEPPLSLGAL